MSSRQIDQPTAVRPGEELDVGALASYLAEHLDEGTGDLSVEQYPRGFSNLTYRLVYGDRDLVLRRPPFGAAIKSAHDMGREFRILSSLSPVYPKVPQPLVYCDDSSVLGAPFYVMERVAGVILRSPLPEASRPAREQMRAIATGLVETLVELHAVDYASAGLGDLGRGQGYVKRQIDGWSKRYRRALTEDLPQVERVAAWLAEEAPTEAGVALIHNDFKYDNLVLDAGDTSRVLAVLDWEMATIGDPLMDLGTTLGYWVDPTDPPELRQLGLSPTTLPGNPTRSELVDLYTDLSGRSIDRPVFYYVYGLFKIAVILQQIYHRYQQGHTSDPRFAGLVDGVRLCGVTAQQAIDKRRIDNLF